MLFFIQALTFAALGRADDAIQTLRVVIEQDIPDHVRRRDEIFQEVVSTSCRTIVAVNFSCWGFECLTAVTTTSRCDRLEIDRHSLVNDHQYL